MSARSQETLRRGWCPSTLRPMETGDGWLVRLHPPGAKLAPAQLRRIAALAVEHGNGLIEISARANLQIRGVTIESHPTLIERLLAEHLVDEHEGDGPQRVTLVSPLAGRNPTGLIDAAALAAQIEQRARTVPGLPAKLWLGPIPVTEAAPTVAAILRDFAALRAAAPDQIRRLRDLSPEALASLSALPEAAAPTPRMPPRRAGLFALEGDRFAALVGLPFGRCDAETLDRLGAAQAKADIRLSPWRGLAFRDLDRTGAEALLRLAGDLGLITQDDDPRLSVQACAGSPACSRAEAPTMADAARLADAAADLLAQGVTLHVSGCVKACAHPAAADLTLVGRDGRYDVVPGGTTRDKPVATLDLSALLTRLQPGQDIHARLAKVLRTTGSQG